MSTKDPKIIGINNEFGHDADGLYLKKSQEIPDWFLNNLKDQRTMSNDGREGEMMKVASIPVVIVEKWMKEGFNILDGSKSGREIVKRLKEENLDAFLTTDKRF